MSHIVSHHSVKFDDHKHCRAGALILLICQTILLNHVKRPLTLRIKSPQVKSPPCPIWCPLALWQ